MERKGTLKELIYTRCGAAYSIREQELPGNNGYAIFNSSMGLWADASEGDLQYAERMIVRQFQWSYGCPVKRSWSYLLMPHGDEGVFADLYAYTEEDGANNSKASNMRGSHLAQMLCGRLTMYPYELIKSPYFMARQQASTDVYYLGECAPRLPEVAQDRIAAGGITQSMIQEFLRGREKPVMHCVAWLIEQMGKPAKERRPIVILDQGEQIPLWIAAITSSFPVSLARRIPFYTCREGLERLNSGAFYRISASSGEFVAQVNMQDPDQESRPLAMLLGCAAEDKEAARVVANLTPDAACVLLDGEAGTARFTPDSRILNSGFVAQLAAGRAVHQAMLLAMDELREVPFSPDMLPLYDALVSLTSKARPTLSEQITGLRTLEPYGDVNTGTIRRTLNSLIEQAEYQNQYIREDAAEGYPLLSEMQKLAGAEPSYTGKIQKILLENLREALKGKPEALKALWKLTQQQPGIMAQTVRTLVGGEKLSALTAQQAKDVPEENCEVILEMQDAFVRVQKSITWENIVTAPDSVMGVIFQRSVSSRNLRKKLMGCLKDNSAAMETYLLGGAAMTGGTSTQRAAWWKTLQEEGYPLALQLQSIQKSPNFGTQDLEQALIAGLHRQGFTLEVQRLYEQYLSSVKDGGEEFFREAVHILFNQGASASAEELEALWKTAQKDSRSAELSHQLMSATDSRIILEETKENAALANFVSRHAKGVLYPHAGAYQFISQITAKSGITGILQRKTPVIQNAWQKANPGFVWLQMDQDLAVTSMGEALAKKLADHSDELASHLLAIAGFRFVDTNAYVAWIRTYVNTLMEKFSGKDPSLGAICALKTTLSGSLSAASNEIWKPLSALVNQAGDGFLRKNTDFLIHTYVQQLDMEKKTAAYAERWVSDCCVRYGEEAANLLKKCTDHAIAVYQQSNKSQGGFFGRLFGRGKD